MHTTLHNYVEATGVHVETAGRRLKNVDFLRPPRTGGRKHYGIAAAMQTLSAPEIEVGAIDRLVAGAVSLRDDLYIEAKALPVARQFASWLPTEAMRIRLRAVQNSFVVAVANTRLCTPAIVRNLDTLRDLFALNGAVLNFVLVGGEAPNVDALAPAFCVTCNDSTLDAYKYPHNLEAA